MSVAQEGDDLQIHLWNNNSSCMLWHRSESTHTIERRYELLWKSISVLDDYELLHGAGFSRPLVDYDLAVNKHPALNDSILIFVMFLIVIYQHFWVQTPFSRFTTALLTGLSGIYSISSYWFLMKFHLHRWRNDTVLYHWLLPSFKQTVRAFYDIY